MNQGWGKLDILVLQALALTLNPAAQNLLCDSYYVYRPIYDTLINFET